jgi:tetratricopeptide (TPR) repeat protein
MHRGQLKPKQIRKDAMKWKLLLFIVVVAAVTVGMASCTSGRQHKTGLVRTSPPEVVVVPTIGNNHQFNLDYTVAHLMALLDAISPDAILIRDYTEWLRLGCPWDAASPETHVALGYARDRSLPIFGTGATPDQTYYEATIKFVKEYREKYPDAESVRPVMRAALDAHTAQARDYSFTGASCSPEVLFTRILPLKLAELTQPQRDAARTTGKQIADELERLEASNPLYHRWVIVIGLTTAPFVEDALRERGTVRVVPISNYLPLKSAAVEKRMDYKTTAWILSGLLDEWFGMWAPQAFPSEHVAALLTRLKGLSPQDPVTEFLEARWLMQNRDYTTAEPILERLVNTAGSARFPFPINGKWIRPPWSSVRDKAKLNLAFVYDYKGERNKALSLYRELLELGDQLNEEARASGYAYDDIRSVIESYTKSPYTGLPEEAFRHFTLTAKIPACAPDSPPK